MSEIGGPVDDGGIAPARDPFELFAEWMKAAEKTEPNEANAMAVATADAEGRPAPPEAPGSAMAGSASVSPEAA